MRKSFTTHFDFGEEVRLITEPDVVRIVTGFFIRSKQVVYIVRSGTEEESYHLAIEMIKIIKPKKIKGFKG
jgi:hypothetical protein